MTELIRRAWDIAVRSINDEARSVDVVASTDSVDSYGEVLVQDWDLSRYLKNPVVLWDHKAYELPIGYATNVRVEDGKLLATLNFVDERANPLAERVWQGFVQKSIRAVSVGFQSQQGITREVDGRSVYVLSGNKLVELSAVSVGANEDAVTAAKSMTIIRALVGAGKAEGEEPEENTDMNLLSALIGLLGLEATATDNDVIAEVTRLSKQEEKLEEVLEVEADEIVGEVEELSEIVEKLEEELEVEAEQIVEEVEELAEIVEELEGLSEKSGKEIVGVVRAWKQGTDQSKGLRKKYAELVASNEARERDDLIQRARSAGKLAPTSLEWAKSCPIEALRGFVETAPEIPQFAEGPSEPESKGVFRGKSWGDLTPGERHALYKENHALYVAMRDSAKA